MNTNKMNMKDESGFGLVSTMVSMGIAMVLFVGIMDMLAVSASTQRGIQIKADRSFFLGQLSNVLLHDPTCTPSLMGNDVSQPMVMRDPADASKSVAQAGMHFPAWDISSIVLQNQRVVDPKMNLYSGDVVITLSHPYRVIGITPTVSKQIATIYYAATEGKITRCFGTTNLASVGKSYCSTMGGTWSDSEYQCALPQAPSSSVVVASNSSTPSDTLSVSQVVSSVQNNNNAAVSTTAAADVLTGVDHPIGNAKN